MNQFCTVPIGFKNVFQTWKTQNLPSKIEKILAKNSAGTITDYQSDVLTTFVITKDDITENFWRQKADLWGCSVEMVKTMRCKNCNAFDQKPATLKAVAGF